MFGRTPIGERKRQNKGEKAGGNRVRVGVVILEEHGQGKGVEFAGGDKSAQPCGVGAGWG